jgi:site-specific DNA-cytosine methylase
MKVYEFFSGIGGMHVSLTAAGVSVDQIIAYDTSPLCNATYQQNFPGCDVRSKLVEQLTQSDIEGGDLWTMSPPWYTSK